MHDQQKALENVGRHLGMFQDKLQVAGKLTLEELVLGAIRKEEAKPTTSHDRRHVAQQHLRPRLIPEGAN